MRGEERRRRILARARVDGNVEVQTIAQLLEVAPETVRRDLRVLEQHGLVRRTHGGAYPVESVSFETSIEHRANAHTPAKRRIAAAAAGRIGDAETVFIDEGFTPLLVAQALPPDTPLTVVTASLPAAAALATRPELTVILLGGRVRGRTMASVGHWVTQMLSGLVLDLAILGANGISREHGLTAPDPAVGDVKAQALRAARRSVFVGVHTKFGISTFHRFGEISDFEALITDTGLSVAEAHRYSLLGPQVIRV